MRCFQTASGMCVAVAMAAAAATAVVVVVVVAQLYWYVLGPYVLSRMLSTMLSLLLFRGETIIPNTRVLARFFQK